jgi:predicted nucleotidyltransferase
MAKVFTPEAVRRGHVPEVESFPQLAATYRDWLPRRRWFAGGILLGSVLQGTHNCRSDIDLLVVFRGRQQTATQDLRELWERHRHVHVPININLWSESELADGRHTIGSGFLDHLRWATENRGLIGSHNPLARIRLMSRHATNEDLLGYIAKKVKKLREFSCEGGQWNEARCRALEDVGMASLHATRRWLALQGHPDHGLRNREDAMHLLGEHDPRLERKLRDLVKADAAYTTALHAYLGGGERKVYVHALGELGKHVGDACVFLDALSH